MRLGGCSGHGSKFKTAASESQTECERLVKYRVCVNRDRSALGGPSGSVHLARWPAFNRFRFLIIDATRQRDKHQNPKETDWGEIKPAIASSCSLNCRKVDCCQNSPTEDAFHCCSRFSLQPEQDPNKQPDGATKAPPVGAPRERDHYDWLL